MDPYSSRKNANGIAIRTSGSLHGNFSQFTDRDTGISIYVLEIGFGFFKNCFSVIYHFPVCYILVEDIYMLVEPNQI